MTEETIASQFRALRDKGEKSVRASYDFRKASCIELRLDKNLELKDQTPYVRATQVGNILRNVAKMGIGRFVALEAWVEKKDQPGATSMESPVYEQLLAVLESFDLMSCLHHDSGFVHVVIPVYVQGELDPTRAKELAWDAARWLDIFKVRQQQEQLADKVAFEMKHLGNLVPAV